jgi:programmed cell death protein 5|tara:strand:+ start:1715 stop:1990 length:276 start_codon:yes stop_codon:yes gene_type:complete
MEKDQLNEARRREEERKAMKDNALRTLLTSEARERLANVKMVKPEVAEVIENSIIQQASTGRLKRPMNDDELKAILHSMQQPKKEFKFKRI